MTTKVQSNRLAQFVALPVASLFILGFFLPVIGTWTGPILGVWFVGTQRIRRGFIWMFAFAFIPSLIMDWRRFPLTGPEQALYYLACVLLASLLGILPFTFHRLTSPRLPGLLSTLPFPLAEVVLQTLRSAWHPFGSLSVETLHQGPVFLLGGFAASFGFIAAYFFVNWFAATLVWMWNQEFRASRIRVGASVFTTVFLLAACYGDLSQSYRVPVSFVNILISTALTPICVTGVILLSAWALFLPGKRRTWTERPETVSFLKSPSTGKPLHVVAEHGRETLGSDSGEQFPVRDGIPDFRKREDLTGENGKYNHLYETIGGLYDDTQRVACALKGLDRNEYFLAYMRKLEVKPGDSVLETSVGTGLSFKYLPRGVKLYGLDLSDEMLASCQANLHRWGMEADLFLGNAESLPFADSSFDVVFHVGGISFFNDQAQAIREMIRVARQGTLLLISDETEEYAQKTYERIPITSSYYKNRKKAVTIPIDLVPAEMENIHLEMIKGGLFYAITFRKPASV